MVVAREWKGSEPPPEASVHEGYDVPVCWLGKRWCILLDGEAQPHVVAYSIPGGWLVRQHRDEQDRPIIEGEGDNRRVALERVTGVVTVERADRSFGDAA